MGGVSGTSGYSASAFWPTGAATPASAPASATPAAGTGSEDFLAGLAGGTGRAASAGSQSSAQMLAAIQDPSGYESAGYHNQLAMLNAFGSGSSGPDDGGSAFDLLSGSPLSALPQSAAQSTAQNTAQQNAARLAATYGHGTSSAGINLLA